MAETVSAADEAELDRALVEGIHQTLMDATGHPIDRASLPIGRVPPGKSLVEFWHLDFPTASLVSGGLDYHGPVAMVLLNDMLSVRRLDSGALNALLFRIRDRLVKIYGVQTGGVMAATLVARCRQAIERPEDFPGLLSDNELRAAYDAYVKEKTAFGYGSLVFGNTAAGIKAAQKAATAPWPPTWLRGFLARVATMAGWVSGASLSLAVAMSNMGERYADRRALEYRDELNRRNLALP